jgi:HNH endonuclease
MVRRNWRQIYVHRLSWVLTYGRVRKGLHVLHRCDVRECFNPSHLFLGTPKDNIHDMISKGRENWSKKLTEEKVIKIRKDRLKGMTLEELSRKYGSSYRNISLILLNKIWTNVQLMDQNEHRRIGRSNVAEENRRNPKNKGTVR